MRSTSSASSKPTRTRTVIDDEGHVYRTMVGISVVREERNQETLLLDCAAERDRPSVRISSEYEAGYVKARTTSESFVASTSPNFRS